MRPQRCARPCQSVCRGWLAQGNRVDRGLCQDPVRWGSTPRLTVIAGSNPAVRWKTYRQWIGLSLGTQKGTRKLPFVCKHHQNARSWAMTGQHRFPVGATQKRPCPRADTVSPRSAPKAPFPRRDGDTQAPGRRFWGHDGETHTTLQEDHIS